MKTLVNVILGAISYIIMLAIGLDFALFWAVMIALLNYIPFVGSLVAVFFRSSCRLPSSGRSTTTLILAALLLGAQLISDNVLEPRLIGRQLNLSPFVIIVALSFWSAIWGLAGRHPRHPDDLDARDHLRRLPGDPVHRDLPCRPRAGRGRSCRPAWRVGEAAVAIC